MAEKAVTAPDPETLKALDAEIDDIMGTNQHSSAEKKKRPFGLGKGKVADPLSERQSTGFGKPLGDKQKRARNSWASGEGGSGPSFDDSNLRNGLSVYSTSNAFVGVKPPTTGGARATIPSNRIVPGAALMGTQIPKTTTTTTAPRVTKPSASSGATYSKPISNLRAFSRPATNVLEIVATGKALPRQTQHINFTPSSEKKTIRSVQSTAPHSWKNAVQTNADDEIIDSRQPPRRVKLRDDDFVLKRPATTKRPPPLSFSASAFDSPCRPNPIPRRESTPVFSRSKVIPLPARRQSGGTAEKPIALEDSDEDQPRDKKDGKLTRNSMRLECLVLFYRHRRTRNTSVLFTKTSFRVVDHDVSFAQVEEMLVATIHPYFLVAKLHDDDQHVVMLPSSEATATSFVTWLKQATGHLAWRELTDRNDSEFDLYHDDVGDVVRQRESRKHKRVSPVILTYPLPPDALDVISITQDDLSRLEPCEYLNDNLVDFYFKWLLAEHMPQCASYAACLSSHFFTKLRDGFENVSNWHLPGALLEKEMIFVPINRDNHWSLAVILYPKQFTLPEKAQHLQTCIATIDSMGCYHKKKNVVRHLRLFLGLHANVDEDDVKVRTDNIEAEDLLGPQQKNGYDCGVYMLLAAKFMLETFQGYREDGFERVHVTQLMKKDAFGQMDVDKTRQSMLLNLDALADKYAAIVRERTT
ncbi:Aste57867_23768 [Aphanomyces stellatus]|uniref:Aste57867_23768 protein n=1 Tax=Aphanomyces stellatus TaxID=120398 RepID=A0A485LNR0_9STRA|nr:hypothetical protein As57867_023695 [Aphanomyces stellatus]VFU00413.1 Aste57867_23768 [Aphanomyces stellatus]